MKQQALKLTFLMIITMMLPSCGFNSFRSFDGNVSDTSEGVTGSSACEIELKTAFANSWHPFLKANCVACHIPVGGTEAGKGAFASSDLNVAFNAFKSGPPAKIGEFAILATHKAPYTGPQHQSTVSGLNSSWASAQVQYEACVASGGGAGGEPPTGPRIETNTQVMAATATARVLNFDIPGFTGAQLRISVATQTLPSGETNYAFTVPTLQAGAQALRLRDIRFLINGTLVSSTTTFASIDRHVPATQSRVLATSQAVVQRSIVSSDTLALSLAEVVAVDFAPPTYTQLTAAAGPNNILRASCFACHGATPIGNTLNLADRNALINTARVIPFFPDQSLVHQRMVSVGAPMPAVGALPPAQVKLVRDWILDGAPN